MGKIPFPFSKGIAEAFDFPFITTIFLAQSFVTSVVSGLSLRGFKHYNQGILLYQPDIHIYFSSFFYFSERILLFLQNPWR